MNEKLLITTSQVEAFLKDVEKNSTTEILEEGKEKDDLMKIAKARGYTPGKSKDLAFFKNTYAFASIANKNKMRLNKKALLKALPTMVGKPVNIDHQRNYVVGHLIDYKYIVKTDEVISYGVIYRANFPEVWEKMRRLFKAKKLTTSYEIWCPEEKRKYHSDGTVELLQQEIAGDAILFRTKPAFAEAKMLAIAKETLEKVDKDLVFASDDKYKGKEKEIITSGLKTNDIKWESDGSSGTFKIDNNIYKFEIVKSADITVVERKPKELQKEETLNQTSKIKCSNCGEEFDQLLQPEIKMGAIKCPKCFAILDQTGKMVHPPQIVNFKMSCPACIANNWLILSKTKKEIKARCQSCSKEYIFEIAEDKSKILREKFQTVYSGTKPCLQCGKSVPYYGVSAVKEKILKCEKCGLEFAIDASNPDRYIKISKITEIGKKDLVKSSKEGGKKMSFEVELTKYHRYIDVDNFEEIAKSSIEDEYDEIVFSKEEKAVRLTYQQRQNLPDSSFAVVVKVKDKKTEKMRKIRKYPIHDKAHVRNALARLGQEKAKEGLRKLGVSIEKVLTKVRQRAKKLGIEVSIVTEPIKKVEPKKTESKEKVEAKKKETDVKLEKYIAGIKKLAGKIKSLKKELETEKANTKFYKENALEIAKRREELDTYAEDLSDKDILNDENFDKAKANKLNNEEVAPETASDKRADKGIDKATELGKKLRKKSIYNVKNM